MANWSAASGDMLTSQATSRKTIYEVVEFHFPFTPCSIRDRTSIGRKFFITLMSVIYAKFLGLDRISASGLILQQTKIAGRFSSSSVISIRFRTILS